MKTTSFMQRNSLIFLKLITSFIPENYFRKPFDYILSKRGGRKFCTRNIFTDANKCLGTKRDLLKVSVKFKIMIITSVTQF